jgi:hypothetical protein
MELEGELLEQGHKRNEMTPELSTGERLRLHQRVGWLRLV